LVFIIPFCYLLAKIVKKYGFPAQKAQILPSLIYAKISKAMLLYKTEKDIGSDALIARSLSRDFGEMFTMGKHVRFWSTI
jgi:hypothetical protein